MCYLTLEAEDMAIKKDVATEIKKAVHEAFDEHARSKLTQFKSWSPLGAMVAIAIFTLVQWNGYTVFKTHTSDRLDVIEKTMRLSSAALSPNNPTSQATVKNVIAELKKHPSSRLPEQVAQQVGTQFVKASPSDLGAWSVARDLVEYRSLLNLSYVPQYHWARLSRTPKPKEAADFTNAYVTGETVPCTKGAWQVHQVGEGILIFSTSGGDKCTAYLRFVGGEVTLDGSYYINTIFENMRITYQGGSLILENVTFVNCTFDIPQPNPETMRLASAVLESTQVTLTSPKG
ncbi:MAG TPA: hypothetical protein VNV82_23240 [Bryobacteraceae bacterium]|jgi:hypothetical protein|nr:hypothetical protein [Bryobacteraceae bacterium]